MRKDVEDYYDGVAHEYHLQYERDLIRDVSHEYPANYFRMHLLINSFTTHNLKQIVEIGVGEGTPLIALAQAGMDVRGIDISKKMVLKAKQHFRENNLDEGRVSWGDIQDPLTYTSLMQHGKYDGLLAMGVMPHVYNDEFVLKNMRSMVKSGGRVFIEFRNKLFSLFTFNRHTYDFIMDDLLGDVDPKLRQFVAEDLRKRLNMDEPVPRLAQSSMKIADGKEEDEEFPGYDAIISKFHNPFDVANLLKSYGFRDINFLWYHYHPAIPFLEKHDLHLFRNEALKMEHEPSGWRGLFLCSAFVIEAVVDEA